MVGRQTRSNSVPSGLPVNGRQAPNELPARVALLLSTFRFMISRREAAVSLTYDTTRNFGCLVYLGVRDCRVDAERIKWPTQLHIYSKFRSFRDSRIPANIALALVKGIRLLCL